MFIERATGKKILKFKHKKSFNSTHVTDSLFENIIDRCDAQTVLIFPIHRFYITVCDTEEKKINKKKTNHFVDKIIRITYCSK